jgi:ComF family protein
MALAAIQNAVRFMRRGLADLVFPPSCVSCSAELDERPATDLDVPFCGDCFAQMEIFAEPMCKQCGAPLPDLGGNRDGEVYDGSTPAAKNGCYRCAGRKLWFDETVALGMYSGKLRDTILLMKEAQGDALSLAMGRLMLQTRGLRLAELSADVIVPVPSHWRRRLVHRTNSAAVLAEVLSDHMRVPLAERLLRRSRYTVRQSELSPTERWNNVRRAFSVRGGYHLKSAHVLLVDDLLTTGATCSAAAKALRAAGAERITVAAVARAMGS